MGRMAAARAAEKAAASAPTSMHAAIELSGHIARLGADRVAEVLRVRLVDLRRCLRAGSSRPRRDAAAAGDAGLSLERVGGSRCR